MPREPNNAAPFRPYPKGERGSWPWTCVKRLTDADPAPPGARSQSALHPDQHRETRSRPLLYFFNNILAHQRPLIPPRPSTEALLATQEGLP